MRHTPWPHHTTPQANTIQVYLAAVTHLHLARGFCSPTHSNPKLSLAIKGIQRSQGSAHLRSKRLPLTVEMLEHLLRLLETDPLRRNDRLMLRTALTFGFFGFLRVSEYIFATRGGFDPIPHPTRSDITWVKNSVHFLIKKSMTDQFGQGTIISMGYTHCASCPVIALRCKPTVSTAWHHQQQPPFTFTLVAHSPQGQ